MIAPLQANRRQLAACAFPIKGRGSSHIFCPMPQRGFTLVEVLLTLSGATLFALGVWALGFQGNAARDALALVTAVRALEAQVATQQQGAYDFSALSDPATIAALHPAPALQQHGNHATQWGAWSIGPIARTDADGTVTPAGGFSIALQALPGAVCIRVASALREGAVTVRVDGLAVADVGAIGAACSTDGGHAVAVEVIDGAKMGPVTPSA
ncbi:prepilin-type N-terminal cleavage/methylation domain-containing protein [Bacillus sp. NP157]|nr:prepilin-type N-terminal cleavage/methylation domain-containing protein [Bacillus sp. NP157]